MAYGGRSCVGWVFLVLFTCRFCPKVTSQITVLPPADGSNVTYAVVANTTNPSPAPTPAPTTAKAPQKVTTTAPRVAPACALHSVYHVRDDLEGHLLAGAKLVELDLTLVDYPHDFLRRRLHHVFTPHHWVRSAGRQGRSLLVLEDNYDFMSLFFLSIGVHQMNVTLRDSPRGCLKQLTPGETLDVFREILLNDFKPQGHTDGSLSVDEHVCNLKIIDKEGYADYRYTCCHKGPDGRVVCEDVLNDGWIDVLLTFIVLTKVLVVLFSPSFLPGNLYRLKYVGAEYVYHAPKDTVKKVKVVVTQYPSTYGNPEKVVKLSGMKGMEYFTTMVNSMHLDKIYQVTFDRVRMSVKSRRLLGESEVPVGFFRVLYNNFLRCRIRKLSPLQPCCDTDILGKLNPGIKVMTWSKCVRILARVLLIFILISPWIIRMWVFYTFEEDVINAKQVAAEEAGLEMYFQGSLTLYLSPLHGFFVIIYIIFIVDSVAYGVISTPMKEKFKMVLRKCLRDMRERSRIEVCGWTTRLCLVPFKMFGVVGLLLFPFYLLVLLPFAVPVIAFYVLPAVNLTVRLLIHLILFMCPSSFVEGLQKRMEKCSPVQVTERFERFSEGFTRVKQQLDLHKVTAEETFERRDKLSKRDIIIQVVVIIMCLVSFWSLTFLLMEVVSFFVEMIVYTLMGIIVNAGATLQYITVAFLTVMYGRSTFNDVHKTYVTYHKQIHALLMARKTEEVDDIARTEESFQVNTALRVQETSVMNEGPGEQEPDVKLIVKEGRPYWHTSSLLLLLDRKDTPYTPEKFFYDVINLHYCGSPGPLYTHYLRAFWSFSRILLFLFFVFVVVMAFGDAYSVSTTNQLLATVAGGFIPFLFRYVFSKDGVPSLYTESVQFRMQFYQAINRFQQNWPVFDIIPKHFGEYNPRDSILLNSSGVTAATDLSSPSIPSSAAAAANHSTPRFGGGGGGGDEEEKKEGEEEKIDLDFLDDDAAAEDDDDGVDMIIDVSTAESRRQGPLGMRLAGSVSMLGADSFNRSASSSARMYRPPPGEPMERGIDVV